MEGVSSQFQPELYFQTRLLMGTNSSFSSSVTKSSHLQLYCCCFCFPKSAWTLAAAHPARSLGRCRHGGLLAGCAKASAFPVHVTSP